MDLVRSGPHLLYYGTGNAAPYNPEQRLGDNKWATSVLARRPAAGALVWAYQFTPHDNWDYDSNAEMILAELTIEGNLRATLLHELIPGHAYFYEMARRSADQFIDYGAFTLVEGWATWCEWNVGHVEQSRFEKACGQRLLRFLHGTDAEALAAGLKKEIEAQGYSGARADRRVLDYFQYPGMIFSYTLGALWLERHFEHQPATEFFSFLRGRSWGDFFQTWQ